MQTVHVGLPPEIQQLLDGMPGMVCFATPVRDQDGAVTDFLHQWANASGLTGSVFRPGMLLSGLDRYLDGIDLVADCRRVFETGEPALERRGVSRVPGSARDLPERPFEGSVVRFGTGVLVSTRELTDQVLAERRRSPANGCTSRRSTPPRWRWRSSTCAAATRASTWTSTRSTCA